MTTTSYSTDDLDEQEDDYERYQYEQALEEQEQRLEHDLHSLLVLCRSLASAPVPPMLRLEIQTLARSLAGCRHCQRMLGDLHGGSCPTGGNRVLALDLDYSSEAAAAPQSDCAPF